jgi:hypothetical protein
MSVGIGALGSSLSGTRHAALVCWNWCFVFLLVRNKTRCSCVLELVRCIPPCCVLQRGLFVNRSRKKTRCSCALELVRCVPPCQEQDTLLLCVGVGALCSSLLCVLQRVLFLKFARSNAGVVGSTPTRGIDVCVRLFCLCCSACR